MKKVLVLGASRYYIENIKSLRMEDLEVHVIDRIENSPGFEFADYSEVIDFSNHEKVLEYAAANKIDAVIPLNDYGVLTSAYVGEKLGLDYHLDIETSRKATSKRRMRTAWLASNVNCPKLISVKTIEECRQAIKDIGFPCILKPSEGLGGGSRGVIVVNHRNEIEDAISFTQGSYDTFDILVEEFVDCESEHSVEVLMQNGVGTVLMIGDNIKKELPYRVNQGIRYPTNVDSKIVSRIKSEALKAVSEIGIRNGVAHVELGVKNGEPYLFELGARCGGGAIPHPICSEVSGVNEFLALTEIMVFGKTKRRPNLEGKNVYYHFLTPKPGSIQKVSLKKMPDSIIAFEFLKKIGDEIKEVKIGPERSGFAIFHFDDEKDLQNKIKEIDDSIEITYAL